ncbi:hypothetical protein [Conexibacter woesei]|uniref:hypothetical protein n=1 Tax=Conexibacter woesei TaxID=191495 RepID=UPI00047DBDBA|nr:hypothetical protein [Conexibacter woesei]
MTVVGGVLPDGAVSARVQDLHDAWHDATVAGELWACLLPHGARGGLPPVVFADAEGEEVRPASPTESDHGESWVSVSLGEIEDGDWDFNPAGWDARVLRGAKVPVLWDDALGADPDVGQVGGDEDAALSVELRRGDTAVDVTGGEGGFPIHDPEREARDLLERTLSSSGDARTAGRAALEAVAAALPATIHGGPEQSFLMLSGGGVWIAVWTDRRGRLDVRIRGTGTPPARLDLTDRRSRDA